MRGFSLIIPAHNEADVIEGTLRSIMANKLDRPLQVIVVANGCTDDTAARARAFGPPVEVIETPVGNKPNALNLGDGAARHFPRAVMDADVALDENVLQKVASAFDDAEARVVSPASHHVCTGATWFLKGYYRLWQSLPHVRRHTMGHGFFAMDEKMRGRFGAFPSLVADDKFIHNLAAPAERRVVRDCFTTVFMPTSFADLIRVKTRWTYGNMELAAARPDLNANDDEPHGGTLKHVAARPWLWVHMPAFLWVYWRSKRAARARFEKRQSAWERADGTRADRMAPAERAAAEVKS